VLVRGIARGLGVDEKAAVTSPTFVIVSEYQGRFPLHHIDAYRLHGEKDIVDLGSRELFFEEAVSVVEWADRIMGALPDERLDVQLATTGESERRIAVTPRGKAYGRLTQELRGVLGGA